MIARILVILRRNMASGGETPIFTAPGIGRVIGSRIVRSRRS